MVWGKEKLVCYERWSKNTERCRDEKRETEDSNWVPGCQLIPLSIPALFFLGSILYSIFMLIFFVVVAILNWISLPYKKYWSPISCCLILLCLCLFFFSLTGKPLLLPWPFYLNNSYFTRQCSTQALYLYQVFFHLSLSSFLPKEGEYWYKSDGMTMIGLDFHCLQMSPMVMHGPSFPMLPLSLLWILLEGQNHLLYSLCLHLFP